MLRMLFRLICKDPWLIFWFIVSLLMMFICNMSISFSCSIDINWTKFVKDSLFAIAGSYVAGYLFCTVSKVQTNSSFI